MKKKELISALIKEIELRDAEILLRDAEILRFQGMYDCLRGVAPTKLSSFYVNGYAYQYELEQKITNATESF